MTLETWKEEFYPAPAKEVEAAKEAVLHSLKKWRGLRPENLDRHEVRKLMNTWIYERDDGSEKIRINASTCALCYHYDNWEHGGDCKECPLYHALGGQRCDTGSSSPYTCWADDGNPEPMIIALKQALNHC